MAPPIHHVTQTMTTLNRLLTCDKISEISENWSNARVLCTALMACWLGGWLAVQPPPPPKNPPNKKNTSFHLPLCGCMVTSQQPVPTEVFQS